MEISYNEYQIHMLIDNNPEKYFYDLTIRADEGCKDSAKKLNQDYFPRLKRTTAIWSTNKNFKKRLISFYEDRIANHPQSSGYSAFHFGRLHSCREITEIPSSEKEAKRLFKIGAKQGNKRCLKQLAWLQHAKGYALSKKDPEKSLCCYIKRNQYYEILIGMGCKRAMYMMGNAYYEGNCGVDIDQDKAIKYFETCAEDGLLDGAKMAARIYGNAKNKNLFDIGKAIHYSEIAIGRGSIDFCILEPLCLLYLTNTIHQNFAKAKFHYESYYKVSCEDDTWHIDGINNMFKYIPSDGYYNYYQGLEFYYSEPDGRGYKQLRNLIKIILGFESTEDAECNPSETLEGIYEIIRKMDMSKVYDNGILPPKLVSKIIGVQRIQQLPLLLTD